MTEKELQLLGFERQDSNEGFDENFYYYIYKVADGLEFISNANDEVEDYEWYVDIFETNPHIRFTEFGDVQGLINILEKRRLEN